MVIFVNSILLGFKDTVTYKENNSFSSVTFKAAPFEPLWVCTIFLAVCLVGLLDGTVDLVNQVCVFILP